jgi:hypothetical protein
MSVSDANDARNMIGVAMTSPSLRLFGRSHPSRFRACRHVGFILPSLALSRELDRKLVDLDWRKEKSRRDRSVSG